MIFLMRLEAEMYLSRVEIDTKNRQKTVELNHLGAYHNWVEQMFPNEQQDPERTRKLWRIDELHHKKYLVILSETAPEKDRLERYGVPDSGETKEYDSFINQLKRDQVVRFRATLNPIRSISTGKTSGKRGKVYPHVTIEQKMKYLIDKSSTNGFSLEPDRFTIVESGYKLLIREKAKPIRVSVVTFEGELIITDPDRFREVLLKGLGKKKAFGCGLITVIPMNYHEEIS